MTVVHTTSTWGLAIGKFKLASTEYTPRATRRRKTKDFSSPAIVHSQCSTVDPFLPVWVCHICPQWYSRLAVHSTTQWSYDLLAIPHPADQRSCELGIFLSVFAWRRDDQIFCVYPSSQRHYRCYCRYYAQYPTYKNVFHLLVFLLNMAEQLLDKIVLVQPSVQFNSMLTTNGLQFLLVQYH